MTPRSADKVMLKKHSSSQVLSSRSRKLWWKLFLWSHRSSFLNCYSHNWYELESHPKYSRFSSLRSINLSGNFLGTIIYISISYFIFSYNMILLASYLAIEVFFNSKNSYFVGSPYKSRITSKGPPHTQFVQKQDCRHRRPQRSYKTTHA